jgi:C4-dicarboxylate transporter, DctM subunit
VDPVLLGLLVAVVTTLILFSGIAIGIGLLVVSIGFLLAFSGMRDLSLVPELFFGKLDSFALLSIPMFILMGGAVASSRAGPDLFLALDRWMTRVPGGLVISNLGACALFSALSGSSPATCAAIGKMGIPAMRERGFPDGVAAGSIAAGGTLGILIPPSVTMIVYGISTETSIGRLFLAGLIPGLMLTALFMAWSLFATWWAGRGGTALASVRYSWREKLEILPRVVPFLLIVAAVLYALYGGIATPSETAALGAVACLATAIIIYRMVQPEKLWAILRDSTRESVMILVIVGAAGVFSYMLSSLFITQAVANSIIAMDVNPWLLLFYVNLFLLVCGFFLPPVAVIVMVAPILLPVILAAGFDPYWFAVVLTINMEIGLISPPVGLNLYVINSIAPRSSCRPSSRARCPMSAAWSQPSSSSASFPGSPPGSPTRSWDPADERQPLRQARGAVVPRARAACPGVAGPADRRRPAAAARGPDGGRPSRPGRPSRRPRCRSGGEEPRERGALPRGTPGRCDLSAAQHRLHDRRAHLLPGRCRAPGGGRRSAQAPTGSARWPRRRGQRS